MLALKGSRFQNQSSQQKITVHDLPNEILDIVFSLLFDASNQRLSSIIPVSLSCHHLRHSANTVLFETVTLTVVANLLSRKSENILRYVEERSQILDHVRHVKICDTFREAGETAIIPDTGSKQITLAEKCLLKMTGLRSISFMHIPIRVIIHILYTLRNVTGLQVTLHPSPSDAPLKTAFVRLGEIFTKASTWRVNLATSHVNLALQSTDVEGTHRCTIFSAIPRASINALRGIITSDVPNESSSPTAKTFESLTELTLTNHTNENLLPGEPQILNIIPWNQLRKLHLHGKINVQNLLPMIADHLTCLLTLGLTSQHTSTFHNSDYLGFSNEATLGVLKHTPLQNLRHFYLSGGCNHLPIALITTPTLETLQLKLPETTALQQFIDPVRRASDITYLATHCPHLTTLALHIGSLENLWHPTAIPGIDVDLSVYQVLNELSKLPNLRTLHLYPPYIPKHQQSSSLLQYTTNNHHHRRSSQINIPTQPLSDEQSIRIFHHLKTSSPTPTPSKLTTLTIGATFTQIHSFRPMSWTVRDAGNGKTHLTTRQAGMDYEIEQVWVGERRLTTRIKRHGYRKPYMPDLGEWAVGTALGDGTTGGGGTGNNNDNTLVDNNSIFMMAGL